MGFREDYLNTKPGPVREALVYNAAIKQGPPKNLVPVTVDGPNGTKITYKTIPDYFSIDGMRVSMSPATAQKISEHFNMRLPTQKMSKQIYEAADTKIRATPLSVSGYTGADGKKYTAQDVMSNRIGSSDAVLRYNDLTDKEIEKSGKPGILIAGHGKDILEPSDNPNDVNLGGWQGKNNNPLQPWTVAHKGQAGEHTEYGLWTRLISDDVTVTSADGKVVHTTMDKLRNNPILSKAIANSTDIKKYKTGPVPVEAGAPPPKGYVRLPDNERTPEIGQIAFSLLKGEQGTVTPFTSDGKQYAGRVEPHYHQPPPEGADPAKYPKPWGWHKGVTIYKAAPGSEVSSEHKDKPEPVAEITTKPQSGRIQFLQRIDSYLSDLMSKI